MFRDDDAARAAYLDALERKAARVTELEDRIRELEAENRELHVARKGTAAPAEPVSLLDAPAIYVDTKVAAYAEALINATDPRRTEGILSGARISDAGALIESARASARSAGRPYVVPDDVRRSALEILPTRIMMKDPDKDPRVTVRAILDVVDVP